jgi:hypothetical protein
MAEGAPGKTPLVFFRSASGSEPVREWLKFLPPDTGTLVALHAFIKKTRKAPAADLALACKRLKELKS